MLPSTSAAPRDHEQSFVNRTSTARSRSEQGHRKNSEGHLVAMAATWWLRSSFRRHRACGHRIQYGARMHVDEGNRSSAASASRNGIRTRGRSDRSRGRDRVSRTCRGQSITETLDESTGIAKRVVIDWRHDRGGGDLGPAIVVKGKDGKVLKLARAGDARYMLSVDAICRSTPARSQVGRHPGAYLDRERQDPLHHRRSAAGCRTVRAPQPKDAAIIAEIAGTIRFGPTTRTSAGISIEPMDKNEEPREVLIPKGSTSICRRRYRSKKGDFIVEGNPRARHPGHQGHRGTRAYLSTKSRRSIGCRACSSTTSTSR